MPARQPLRDGGQDARSQIKRQRLCHAGRPPSPAHTLNQIHTNQKSYPESVSAETALDRLARSTRDLLNILDDVAKRGGGFRSLRDSWADTTTPHGRLMLTVLGGLAEFRRELILTRTGEGRARARARGVRLGRKPKLTPHQRMEALSRRGRGESVTDIARSYAVHHATISRLS